MDIVRCVSALTLGVALSLIGIPLPAHAADHESPPSRILTINGLPLSQFLGRTATGDPLPLVGLSGQETGQISGVALDSGGQPLANHTVRLKRIRMVAGLQGEQIRGTATTDAAGRFSFTGLSASEYVVEVLSGDEVIASASVTLAEGAMQVGSVAFNLSEDKGWSLAAKIGAGAAIGVVVFFVVSLIVLSGIDS